MLQEKPKRKRTSEKPAHAPQRALLMVILAIIISVPTTLMWTTRRSDHLIDMVAMGIILCCLIVIVYQAVLSVLQALLGTQDPLAAPVVDEFDTFDDL